MDYKLTNDELAQLDMLMGILRVEPENMPLEPLVRASKPFFRKGPVPLPLEHEAHAENFLVAELEGRCKLSKETRLKEEARLAARAKRRKPYRAKAKGRFHHKRKAKTKRARQRKAWVQVPLAKLRRVMKQGVDIREDQWDRLIAPVWGEGARVFPATSGALTVYNIRVVRDGVQVYDGPGQMVLDAQDPRYHEDVMAELKKTR